MTDPTNVRVVMPSGDIREVAATETLANLLDSEHSSPDNPIVAAIVNNEVLDLSRRIRISATLKPVYLDSEAGARCYRRSLCFLLPIARRQVFPDRRLVIGHSLGDAYYFHFADGRDATEEDVRLLTEEMRRLVEADLPIHRRLIAYEEAVRVFEDQGMLHTATLLNHRSSSRVAVQVCGDFVDLSHAPLLQSTGALRHFELQLLAPGFVLRYPNQKTPTEMGPYEHSDVLFNIYQEYKEWGQILNVSSVGSLNEKVRNGAIADFIRVNEALQEKKIGAIADQIASKRESVRIVLIAGPSSSGKTTFTKRLAIQLTVHGLQPQLISVDDYFVDRDETPRDEDGKLDFENIHGVDIKLLNEHLLSLFDGKEVRIPNFDFKTGSRRAEGKPLKLSDRSILLMEGIHCLNDELTPRIPADRKHKIYISALTQLNLDEHNRIPTTDNRLVRRMVRDFQFRGHSAINTLAMWPSVRRGEERNIFPFQDTADSAFNSALDYELGVLKKHAEPLLMQVKPQHEVYDQAVKLLLFLSNFANIADKLVPDYSIVREFIGDSGFRY
jgi:uridine kinase